MTLDLIGACLLIFVARLGDVSLDTLRMVAVIRGRRGVAFAFGFCQVLIWIFAVSQVVNNLTLPFAIAYSLGFATGNFLGITIENWLAHGEQVIRVFTRQDGDALAHRLRGHGYRVTVIDGRGRDGAVWLLYIEASRKAIRDVARLARQMDPNCFYVIEDVRAVSRVEPTTNPLEALTTGKPLVAEAPASAARSGDGAAPPRAGTAQPLVTTRREAASSRA